MKKINLSKKAVALTLATTMLMVGVGSGTLAWLTDDSGPITNTFTTSDINVTLSETTNVFKMIPGATIAKNPVVTVEEGSEDCWVFIEVEESNNLDDYIFYQIDEKWTLLSEGGNVYYTSVSSDAKIRTIEVLGNGSQTELGVTVVWNDQQVAVKPSVTKEMMEAVDGIKVEVGDDGTITKSEDSAEIAARPTLTFTAYAAQYWKNDTVPFEPSEAWALVNNTSSGSQTSGEQNKD